MPSGRSWASGVFLWAVVAFALFVPITLATQSSLLAWRTPVYHVAGYAGVLGLALMAVQPLLAAGYLKGLSLRTSRKVHRYAGVLLVFCVTTHLVTLWITSPPDVVDALLFLSPTPFSAWGVVAMWAIFAAGGLAIMRQRLPLRVWRPAHSMLVSVAVGGTVVHALLIEGTMETISKTVLCALVLLAASKAVYDLRSWTAWRRRGG